MAFKRGSEIATIDCALVTVETKTSGKELKLDTATKINVTTQTETQDAIKLIIKGRLLAQKRAIVTLTGNTIVLTDNVFIPELVQIFQGGVLVYDSEDPTKIVSYTPPKAGDELSQLETFTLNAYSAIYGPSGLLSGYEKISYPNCQGIPISLSSEDNVFRVPEYTIYSAPDTGEPAYKITWIGPDELPA